MFEHINIFPIFVSPFFLHCRYNTASTISKNHNFTLAFNTYHAGSDDDSSVDEQPMRRGADPSLQSRNNDMMQSLPPSGKNCYNPVHLHNILTL